MIEQYKLYLWKLICTETHHTWHLHAFGCLWKPSLHPVWESSIQQIRKCNFDLAQVFADCRISQNQICTCLIYQTSWRSQVVSSTFENQPIIPKFHLRRFLLITSNWIREYKLILGPHFWRLRDGSAQYVYCVSLTTLSTLKAKEIKATLSIANLCKLYCRFLLRMTLFASWACRLHLLVAHEGQTTQLTITFCSNQMERRPGKIFDKPVCLT